MFVYMITYTENLKRPAYVYDMYINMILYVDVYVNLHICIYISIFKFTYIHILTYLRIHIHIPYKKMCPVKIHMY